MNRAIKKSRERKARQNKFIKEKKMSKVIAIVGVFLLIATIVSAAMISIIKANKSKVSMIEEEIINEQEDNEIEIRELTKRKLTMTVVGDIMCSKAHYEDAYDEETQSYDFNYLFDNVRTYLRLSDLTIGNLETTFIEHDSTPTQLGNALKNSGFNMLTTANDHSLDKGFAGVKQTLDFLDTIGMSHTGTSRTEHEKDRVIIKNAKDINIAFLSYTYGTATEAENNFCINIIDKDKIFIDINKAREQGADLVCVSVHWGKEFSQTITNEQKDIESFLFENGVDVILGTHPHVLQEMEKKSIVTKDGEQKDVFVAYSLGNFMSTQDNKYANISIMLNLEFEKKAGTSKVVLSNVSYRPIYLLKDLKSVDKKYMILDIEDSIIDYEEGNPGAVSKETYNNLKKALEDISKLINY